MTVYCNSDKHRGHLLVGYFDFDSLEIYTGMSKRWWRSELPKVPHLRLPGKILFRKSDVDAHLQQFMKVPEPLDLRGLVDRVVQPRLRGSKGRFKVGDRG